MRGRLLKKRHDGVRLAGSRRTSDEDMAGQGAQRHLVLPRCRLTIVQDLSDPHTGAITAWNGGHDVEPGHPVDGEPRRLELRQVDAGGELIGGEQRLALERSTVEAWTGRTRLIRESPFLCEFVDSPVVKDADRLR